MIKFTCSIGGVEIDTECTPTDSLGEQVEWVVDEFDDVGVEVDAEGKAYIKETIRGAVRQKEDKIKNLVNEIHSRHDMEKVNKIFAAKIYPGNVQDAIPKATRIEKRMYTERMDAKDDNAVASMERQKVEMENALKDYTFQASMKVGAYGPVQQVFAGADYVHQEETMTNPFAGWAPKTTNGNESETSNGDKSNVETAAPEA